MQISVAQALKEKKRLVGEIAFLWQHFQNENSCLETHKRKIDVKQTLQTIEHYTAKLVELKTKISLANQGEHLHNMQSLAEIKKEMEKLAATNGSEDSVYDNCERITRTAVFSVKQLNQMQFGLRRKADELQDKLDAHNAKTTIEYESPLK